MDDFRCPTERASPTFIEIGAHDLCNEMAERNPASPGRGFTVGEIVGLD
jgi:hypothetical protein